MAAAISAGDLALAMSRANASARLAGSDMDKFIGYVTTVADVTQKSAESVGESFKTIYRIFIKYCVCLVISIGHKLNCR